VYVAPATPDASLVVVVGLPVLLAVRIGGRRGRIGVQVMLMMIVQAMMVVVMMVMMMSVVLIVLDR